MFCENETSNTYGYIRWREATGNVAEITDILVHQRRRGHGTNFVLKVIDQAKKKNITRLYVFAEAGNTGGHAFWEALGFERLAELPGFYPGGDGVIYLKKLQ